MDIARYVITSALSKLMERRSLVSCRKEPKAMISLVNEVLKKTMKSRVEETDTDTSCKRIPFIVLFLLSHWTLKSSYLVNKKKEPNW